MDLEINESIYNLIPRPEVKQERHVKYKSRFNQTSLTKCTERTRQDKNYKQTPGRTNENMTVTRGLSEFQMGGRNNPSFKNGASKYTDMNRKAMLPKQTSMKAVVAKTQVDFIAENAVKNIHSRAAVAHRNVVDSRNGNKQLLERSGLQPVYVFKKEYGKAPDYLMRRREEAKQDEKDIQRYMEEQERQTQMKKMSEDDKKSIIVGLKQNWEQVYKEYLGMPMLIDTPNKKQHKERLEKVMKELEDDLQSLQSHNIIYINDY